MHTFSSARTSVAVALALVALLVTGQRSHATTFVVPYVASNIPVAVVTGTSGTLNFTLDLNDPTLAKDIFGSFSVDLAGPSTVYSVGLLGDTASDGTGPNSLGDAALNPSFEPLPNVTKWYLNVAAAGLPLSIIVTSQLSSFYDLSFIPTLTIEVADGGNLTVSPTPLPGALALFATGAGVYGWFGLRKSRRRSTATAAV
jgi:hypothetical protein